MGRQGARALQARMLEVIKSKSLQISYMRACKARAPSYALVVLYTMYFFNTYLVANGFLSPKILSFSIQTGRPEYSTVTELFSDDCEVGGDVVNSTFKPF